MQGASTIGYLRRMRRRPRSGRWLLRMAWTARRSSTRTGVGALSSRIATPVPEKRETLLSLDVGTKTIGVAICEGGVVLPVFTLARASVARDTARLKEFAEARTVTAVIVGLPYELDGSEGRSARLARQIGGAMALFGLPVHYQDERFTTVEALDRLGSAGVFGVRRKAAVDQVAACVILEEWIKSRRA
ncbi:MAG: Holliday junction resolvase RuvX [Myxococcales bacterium]|nr:Holliday junction resolvase RuvX [Myxococcales bacterium]